MDSNTINDFLKGFDELPLYCRYMLKNKGARHFVLGEQCMESLEHEIWNDI